MTKQPYYISAIVLLIIISFLINCSNRTADVKIDTDNNKSLMTLNFPNSSEDTLKVSYFADTVIYVPLETTTESLTGIITQLWLNDSIILISCMNTELLMFNINGKFLRKIGKKGRGPGEYQNIFHFDILKDTIYISSTGKRSWIRYNFEGKFCDEVQLKFQPVYFNFTADNRLAYYDHFKGKIYVYKNVLDKPDTLSVEYGVSDLRYSFTEGSKGKPYFQKTNEGLLFTTYLNDTIWNINGSVKEFKYILKTKEKLLPWDKQSEYFKWDFEGFRNSAKSYFYMHPVEFRSYSLFFQKNYMGTFYYAIYLKNNSTGNIRRFNYQFIYDDIVGKQRLKTVVYTYSPDYLVTYSETLRKLNDMKANKNITLRPCDSWMDQMQNINESDNPVLALVKIKRDTNK